MKHLLLTTNAALLLGIFLDQQQAAAYKEIKKSEGEKPVGTPMELGKPLDWIPYDEKITAFSRKRAENDDDETNREVNLMRFELVEAEIEVFDFNYLYDLLLHGTPGWANIPDDEVIEEYRQRFER